MVQQLDHSSKRCPDNLVPRPAPIDLAPLPAGEMCRVAASPCPAGEARPRRSTARPCRSAGTTSSPSTRSRCPRSGWTVPRSRTRRSASSWRPAATRIARLWTDEGWAWRERQGVRHPRFWRSRRRTAWVYRDAASRTWRSTRVADWPVYVSWAEAAAYRRVARGRLPTEAEFHRAAYGSRRRPAALVRGATTRPRPGTATSASGTGRPRPWAAFPDGASAWGALDLVGNGWEWTGTPFAPFPGFEPHAQVPRLLGRLLRRPALRDAGRLLGDRSRDWCGRSFRNWFQPHYPYVFAKFRCVEDGPPRLIGGVARVCRILDSRPRSPKGARHVRGQRQRPVRPPQGAWRRDADPGLGRADAEPDTS